MLISLLYSKEYTTSNAQIISNILEKPWKTINYASFEKKIRLHFVVFKFKLFR